MKKKVSVVLLSVVFILISVSSICALELGVKGGVHEPIDDYGDIVDTGFTVGGHLKGEITHKFDWGVHLGFAMASGDDVFGGVEVDFDVTMVELYPFVDFYPLRSDSFGLFFRGGLGFNSWQTEAEASGPGISQTVEDDGTDLMFTAGAGINLARSFELVALFNRAFYDDDADYITVTIGYNFDLSR